MTRLGIVVALVPEARALGLRGPQGSEVTALADEIMVCVSGIGPVRAGAAGKRLLAHGATALLSWGTAVALDNQIAAGQLLLPRNILRMNGDSAPVSPDWRQQLHNQFITRFEINDQPLISTDRMLVRPTQKSRLFAETGAVAADMESAEVAAVARAAGVSFVVVRAIADTTDRTIPKWITGAIDGLGQPRIASLLLPLIMHPADWPDIKGLASDFRTALNSLQSILTNGNCAILKPVLPGSEAATSV